MQNKLISFLKIVSLIGLLTVSSHVTAAYYYDPDPPDYAIVTVPCHQHYYSSTYHRHHHYRHHRHHATVSHHKRSNYSITKYYVYRNAAGDLIWMPSPCDCCCGTWIKVQSNRGFFEEPYRGPAYSNNEDDEIDFDMDMRTADDVDDGQ